MSLSLPQQQPLKIDVKLINSQIAQLFNKQSTYERQKSWLFNQLCQFLASLPMPKDIMSASPHNVVRFLVWKDKTGKTQVHSVGCPHRGLGGHLSVGAPTGLLLAMVPLTP